MLRNIYLYGKLKEQFGKVWELDVESFAEAVRAINALTKGKFIQAINLKGKYRVVRGEDLNEGDALNGDTIKMNFKKGDFHIAPVPAGGGGGSRGWLTIVIGVVIIVASIYFAPAAGGYAAGTFGAAAAGGASSIGLALGASLILSGVSTLLTPMPSVSDYGQQEKADERPSFIFNGPVNTIEQGGSIPIVYGKMRIGSTVISSALDIEEVPV